MTSKRLLTVVGSYFPAVGGGEFANARLARLAMEAGWDVLVLAPSETPSEELVLDPLGIPVRYSAARRFAHHRLIERSELQRAIANFRPSVVQFDGPNLHDFYGIRLARENRIPTVGFYHADYRDDNVVSRIATLVYGITVVPLFDRIAVTTEAYASRLRARGVPREKISVIGLGADLDLFKPADRENYLLRAAPVALFVGRLDRNHSYKRIDLLLRALAAMPGEIRPALRVIGDGDTRGLAELLARDLHLEDSVTFLGSVDDARLSQEYRNADVLVLPSPSKSEGFGMVLLEAYASGCPAVTSVFAGGCELIERAGVGELWDGRNLEDLVRAITAAATTGADRAESALRARNGVCQGYTWPRVGNRMNAILNDLLMRTERID